MYCIMSDTLNIAIFSNERLVFLNQYRITKRNIAIQNCRDMFLHP